MDHLGSREHPGLNIMELSINLNLVSPGEFRLQYYFIFVMIYCRTDGDQLCSTCDKLKLTQPHTHQAPKGLPGVKNPGRLSLRKVKDCHLYLF